MLIKSILQTFNNADFKVYNAYFKVYNEDFKTITQTFKFYNVEF